MAAAAVYRQSKIPTDKMSSLTNPFIKNTVSADSRFITLYPKKGATWEQMSAWLEQEWSDPAYDWKGFGKIGDDDFVVVLRRRWMSSDESDEEESDESYTRTCMECGEDFTPSVDHADDGVCDECVCEKGKKQVLKQ